MEYHNLLKTLTMEFDPVHELDGFHDRSYSNLLFHVSKGIARSIIRGGTIGALTAGVISYFNGIPAGEAMKTGAEMGYYLDNAQNLVRLLWLYLREPYE